MKKKIAILGSTGSIGKAILNIILKDKKNFEIILLSANKNYKELIKQTKKFKVKNVIINDKHSYIKFKKINKDKKIKIFTNFNNFKNIFKKKIDYTMSSIVGLKGLEPTIKIIKFTKVIAIANKESIICAWHLIDKELKKRKTRFIPVDSEHFSIWYAIKNNKNLNIDKIYLTASGGPLLNISKKKFNNLRINEITKHPNWQMGKKISVDSSTMINKVFEVIEAKKIFNIDYSKLNILIHPKSYIHAIIKFNDGMIKLIAHDTTMEIPIYNTVYEDNVNKFFKSNINIKKLNKLDLRNVDKKKFPLVKILKTMPNSNSLFETVLVSANDELVRLFLRKKIKYSQIISILNRLIKMKEFIKLKNIEPKSVSEVVKINDYVRFKINSLYIQ